MESHHVYIPVKEGLLLLSIRGIALVELIGTEGRHVRLNASCAQRYDVDGRKEHRRRDVAGDAAQHHHHQTHQVDTDEDQDGVVAAEVSIGDITTEQRGDITHSLPGRVLHIRIGVGVVHLGLEEQHKRSSETEVSQALAELRDDDITCWKRERRLIFARLSATEPRMKQPKHKSYPQHQ